jgi:hypothetical protein
VLTDVHYPPLVDPKLLQLKLHRLSSPPLGFTNMGVAAGPLRKVKTTGTEMAEESLSIMIKTMVVGVERSKMAVQDGDAEPLEATGEFLC